MTPGRRFGLELGIAALTASAVLARRGSYPAGALATGIVGAALMLLALVRPAVLASSARRWSQFAARISHLATPVLLAIIYLGVLTPVAWLRRTMGRSPTRRDPSAATYWVARERLAEDASRSRLERQF